MSYLTVPLHPSHTKKGFTCGKELLDNYLHIQAKQDVKRKLSACFVLTDEDNNVKGYYTLSSTSIHRDMLTENVKSKLPPSYHHLPTTLLGRLAIDSRYKGQGLGGDILIDALKRSFDAAANVGSMAVVVDPIDDEAIKFYEKYGFTYIPDNGKMVMSMETIAKLF